MKLLILRFSSIGDILLTTPVIRCLKQQLPEVSLHFVTKAVFRPLLEANPYIDQIHVLSKEVDELIPSLKAENFDQVIDLHHNLRSARLKRALGVPSQSFNKINVRKALAVNFKWMSLLPAKHVVDRYFETVSTLGVHADGAGLDYFLKKEDHWSVNDHLFMGHPTVFVTLVAGGSYYTKRIPPEKIDEICSRLHYPVLILGDENDGKMLMPQTLARDNVHVLCGKLSINQSASVVQQSEFVITSDTGLMHAAAAFNKPVISVWGNTVPEFGMGPYQPNILNIVVENNSLKCRPCSKLGFHKCPLGHFKCMRDLRFDFLEEL